MRTGAARRNHAAGFNQILRLLEQLRIPDREVVFHEADRIVVHRLLDQPPGGGGSTCIRSSSSGSTTSTLSGSAPSLSKVQLGGLNTCTVMSTPVLLCIRGSPPVGAAPARHESNDASAADPDSPKHTPEERLVCFRVSRAVAMNRANCPAGRTRGEWPAKHAWRPVDAASAYGVML